MSTIKIETLTAVHIGMGETLHIGTDVVRGEEQGQKILSVVDLKKVMEKIGTDNIQKWVDAVEDGQNTEKIVKDYVPDATIADYSKRMILNRAKETDSDSLKTQIHDGFGRPYIPGSSIKGAIRTAVLASLVSSVKDKDIEKKIDKTKRDMQGNPIPDFKGRIRYKSDAKRIESDLFGKDAKEDTFRFMQVGDAIFGKNDEVALNMVNINEREREGYWDIRKAQLVEAIGAQKHADFQLKLNLSRQSELLKKLKSEGHDVSKYEVYQRKAVISSIGDLFDTINAHTRQLLEDEKKYWKKRESKDSLHKVTQYLNRIEAMLSEVQQCKPGQECVLRIGQGSGWRFITGAWTENLPNFSELVIPLSRPHNEKYEGYDFPKTRRVNNDQCELLGFVKLSINEETT